MSVCPLANSNIIADSESPQAPPLLFFFFFFFAARAAHRQRRVLVFPQISDLARRLDVLWAFWPFYVCVCFCFCGWQEVYRRLTVGRHTLFFYLDTTLFFFIVVTPSLR